MNEDVNERAKFYFIATVWEDPADSQDHLN